MYLNHPQPILLPAPYMEKSSSTKLVPGAKNLGTAALREVSPSLHGQGHQVLNALLECDIKIILLVNNPVVKLMITPLIYEH